MESRGTCSSLGFDRWPGSEEGVVGSGGVMDRVGAEEESSPDYRRAMTTGHACALEPTILTSLSALAMFEPNTQV